MNISLEIQFPDLADRLETARQQSGLSYSALAKKVGVTHTAVWQILTGKNKATKIKTALAIADALGIDIRDEIFEKVEDLLDDNKLTD